MVLRLQPAAGAAFFRSYSLSGPIPTERYRISVKMEPNGAAGDYLREHVRVGARFRPNRSGFVPPAFFHEPRLRARILAASFWFPPQFFSSTWPISAVSMTVRYNLAATCMQKETFRRPLSVPEFALQNRCSRAGRELDEPARQRHCGTVRRFAMMVQKVVQRRGIERQFSR